MIDWDNPEARLAMLEDVGAQEYTRRFLEHRLRSVVAVINGYPIWPVKTRYGRLFAVGGTTRAFTTLAQAKAWARTCVPGPEVTQ
jgi:hypothetical protein